MQHLSTTVGIAQQLHVRTKNSPPKQLQAMIEDSDDSDELLFAFSRLPPDVEVAKPQFRAQLLLRAQKAEPRDLQTYFLLAELYAAYYKEAAKAEVN